MASLSGDILQDWEEASRREWLVTNGIGGYASASLAGANTRRYHGLLVPALHPPLGRTVVLSKVEEEVRVEDELYLLSANRYPSVVQPQGYRHLAHFESRPIPTFTYVFHEASVVLEKRIWMPYGFNTVYVQYSLVKAPEKVKIGLLPLSAYKDYHSEQHRWDGFRGITTVEPNGSVKFLAYPDARSLTMYLDRPAGFSEHSGWFYNFEHAREQERGLDFSEDLFCPGRFDVVLAVGQSLTFVATTETEKQAAPADALGEEMRRQEKLLATAGVDAKLDSRRAQLTLAADQFVIPKTKGVARATVIAGYHWFTDWGRDTMIALPGLCLSTCRFDIAREIITTFAGAVKNGLIPNRFTDDLGASDYNTVDASLWFFHAIHQYAESSGDWDFAVTKMLPVLADILDHHMKGTDYGIHVDTADGLLSAGAPGAQLTWMDARVGDWVVTPRAGKPVEINALWYNALKVTAALYHRAGNDAKATDFDKRASKVKKAFAEVFWNPGTHSLFDVIGTDGRPDPALRPNQIFAVSLPFGLIEGEKAKQIVEVVEANLLTPYGLRTLAPGSPNYRPRYAPGDQTARDGAYHQGTIWPWLIGHFIDAHLKVYKNPAKSRALLETLLTKAMDHYGMGTINEIFDAEPPYAPNGCIAQAWSVSEVLRALINTTT